MSVIGKAFALYALWQAWRGRKAWRQRSPSLLALQEQRNALRAQRRALVAMGLDPERWEIR